MSTVATLLVRVAGDTKDAEKAFAGLETAGKGLERAFSGLGTRLSGVGGDLAKGLGSSLSGIESAAGKALRRRSTRGWAKSARRWRPIANMLPGLPGPVSALAGAFGGFVPVAGRARRRRGRAWARSGGSRSGSSAAWSRWAKARPMPATTCWSSRSSPASRSRTSPASSTSSSRPTPRSTRSSGRSTSWASTSPPGARRPTRRSTRSACPWPTCKKLKPEDAFVAIVDGLGKIPEAGQRAAAGAAIFGKGWHDVSQLATEDLRGLMTEADQFGATMSTELAVAGDRFNDTLGQLSTIFEGFKRAIGAGVLPVLRRSSNCFARPVVAAMRAAGITASNTQDTFTALAIAIAQGVAIVARGIAGMLSTLADPTLLATLNGLLQTAKAFAILKTPAMGGGTGKMAQALVVGFADFDPSKFLTAATQIEERVADVQQAADRWARDLPAKTKTIQDQYKAQADALRDTAAASRTFGAATDTVDDAMQKLIATLSGANVIAAGKQMETAFKEMARTGVQVTREGAIQIKEALDKWFDALRSTGQKIPEETQKIWLAMLPPPRFEHQWLNAVKQLPAPSLPVPLIAAQLQGGWDAIGSAIKWETFPQQAEQAFKNAKWGALLGEWSTQLVTTVNRTVADMLTGIRGFEEGFRDIWRGIQAFGSSVINEILTGITAPLVDGIKNSITNIDWSDLGAQGTKQGAIAGAVVGAAVGVGFTQAFGAQVGIGMGAISGAIAGAMVGGPTAAIVGGAVGAGAAIVAAVQGAKAQAEALRQSRAELVANYGGVENLRAAIERLGYGAEETQRRFDELMNTDRLVAYTSRVALLNEQLTAQRIAIEKMGKGLEETAASGNLLSRELRLAIRNLHDVPGGTEGVFAFLQQQAAAAGKGIETFLANTTVKTKAGVAAIGASLAGLYEELLRQGVAPSAAFAQLEPAIFRLQEQLAKAGIAAPAAFQPLADLARLSADAITGPLLDAMNGSGQGLTSLHNLGLLTQESFSGFAAEMLAGFKAMEAQGKGGIAAVQGMRGPLQKLWELQKDFGFQVTEDEQKLLDFAEAGGQIGDKFRPATDRMVSAVDKLVDRLDKFLTKLTEMPTVAAPAAQGVENAINRIKPLPIQIPYVFVPENELPTGGGSVDLGGSPGALAVPAFARGGDRAHADPRGHRGARPRGGRAAAAGLRRRDDGHHPARQRSAHPRGPAQTGPRDAVVRARPLRSWRWRSPSAASTRSTTCTWARAIRRSTGGCRRARWRG